MHQATLAKPMTMLPRAIQRPRPRSSRARAFPSPMMPDKSASRPRTNVSEFVCQPKPNAARIAKRLNPNANEAQPFHGPGRCLGVAGGHNHRQRFGRAGQQVRFNIGRRLGDGRNRPKTKASNYNKENK